MINIQITYSIIFGLFAIFAVGFAFAARAAVRQWKSGNIDRSRPEDRRASVGKGVLLCSSMALLGVVTRFWPLAIGAGILALILRLIDHQLASSAQ